MKCPKCGYTSFDYLRECKKCGEPLDDSRKALNLKMGKPTLFTEMGGELKNKEKSEMEDKPEKIVDRTPAFTEPSSLGTDFSSSSSLNQPPTSQTLPSHGKPQNTVGLSEDTSSELGALGSMGNIQPRGKLDMDNSSEVELDLPVTNELGAVQTNDIPDSLEGLERNQMDTPIEELDKESEFILFDGDNKSEIKNQLEDDIQFEFSADDLESDINLSIPSENSDEDTIELELDLEDDESLDQILAEFETNDNVTK